MRGLLKDVIGEDNFNRAYTVLREKVYLLLYMNIDGCDDSWRNRVEVWVIQIQRTIWVYEDGWQCD